MPIEPIKELRPEPLLTEGCKRLRSDATPISPSLNGKVSKVSPAVVVTVDVVLYISYISQIDREARCGVHVYS
jgi:hypothetical protein